METLIKTSPIAYQEYQSLMTEMLSHFNVETTSEIQLNPNQSAHRDPIGRLVSFSTTNLSQLSSQEPVTRVEQSICMNYSPLESPTQPDSIRIQCGRGGGGRENSR